MRASVPDLHPPVPLDLDLAVPLDPDPAARARRLHEREPGACFRFFDDDLLFDTFRRWDEHYADGVTPTYFPEAWAEEHFLARLLPMGRADGTWWELDAAGPKLMSAGGGPLAVFGRVRPDEARAAAAAIERSEPARRKAETDRRAADERRAAEEERRRRTEAADRERAAKAALAEVLRTPGELGSKEGIDGLAGRLGGRRGGPPRDGVRRPGGRRSRRPGEAAARLRLGGAAGGRRPAAAARDRQGPPPVARGAGRAGSVGGSTLTDADAVVTPAIGLRLIVEAIRSAVRRPAGEQ